MLLTLTSLTSLYIIFGDFVNFPKIMVSELPKNRYVPKLTRIKIPIADNNKSKSHALKFSAITYPAAIRSTPIKPFYNYI